MSPRATPSLFGDARHAWVVLVLSLGVTGAVWYQLDQSVAREAQQKFEHRAQQIEATLRERLEDYRLALQAGLGLFASSTTVSREEWRTFVAAMQLPLHYSGIQGMGYAPLVVPGRLDAHVRQANAEGLPGYRVGPEGHRDIYAPIFYLEPATERNRAALGYDMYGEPRRREAMERARDSGLPSISGKLALAREGAGEHQAAFLMYVPHYKSGKGLESRTQRREALSGWVFAPFRMDHLMRNAFGASNENEVDVEIFDGAAPSEDNELYDSDGSGRLFRPHSHTPFATANFQIDFGGRLWTARLHSLPGFESRLDWQKPRYALASGLLISLLLFTLTRNLISTRGRAEALAAEMTQALAASENRYRQMFETNRSVKLIIDPADGRIIHANPAATRYYGYTLDQLTHMNITDINVMPPDELKAEMARAKEQDRLYFNFRHRLAGGEVRNVEVYSGPVVEGDRTLLYSVIHDVTALHRTLAEQRAILDNAVTGIAHLRNRRFIWVNPKLEQMFGYGMDELVGKPTEAIYANRSDADQVGAEAYPILAGGKHYETECLMRRKDGTTLWVHLSGKLLDTGNPDGGSIWVLVDVSAVRAAQEDLLAQSRALRDLSQHDPLTGLYNRRHLDQVLTREVQLAQRKSRQLAAIMLDIDYFKRVNDTFGHAAGDEVLRSVANLLTAEIRETDLACRYGGEEFLLLMPETGLETALARAEDLRRKVGALRLRHQEKELGPITISLGVAVLPDHAAGCKALVTAADTALYEAKGAGRNRVMAFAPSAP